MACTSTPYEQTAGYQRKSSSYSKKASFVNKKTSPFEQGSDTITPSHICPALLQEVGGLILTENDNFILI